jgi:TPR repeat protein
MKKILHVLIIGLLSLAGSSCTTVPKTAQQQRLLDAHLANAKTGDAFSQMVAANIYSTGEPALRDPKQAVHWLRRGAEQGDELSQMMLGACLLEGIGGLQDLTQGIKWLELAARQNQVEAQYILGMCCEDGLGVPRDLNKAIVWYSKAAAGNSSSKDSWASKEARKKLNQLLAKPLTST